MKCIAKFGSFVREKRPRDSSDPSGTDSKQRRKRKSIKTFKDTLPLPFEEAVKGLEFSTPFENTDKPFQSIPCSQEETIRKATDLFDAYHDTWQSFTTACNTSLMKCHRPNIQSFMGGMLQKMRKIKDVTVGDSLTKSQSAVSDLLTEDENKMLNEMMPRIFIECSRTSKFLSLVSETFSELAHQAAILSIENMKTKGDNLKFGPPTLYRTDDEKLAWECFIDPKVELRFNDSVIDSLLATKVITKAQRKEIMEDKRGYIRQSHIPISVLSDHLGGKDSSVMQEIIADPAVAKRVITLVCREHHPSAADSSYATSAESRDVEQDVRHEQ